MNVRFIESCHIPLVYQKKAGTKGSYYQRGGKRGILPNRLSLGVFAQRRESQKDILKKNEINGQYKKAEVGLYTEMNKGRIHSSIWGHPDFPRYYGYGILDERHGIYDLLILHSEDNLDNMDIHIFRGLGRPEYLNQAFKYLQRVLKKAPLLGLGDNS